MRTRDLVDAALEEGFLSGEFVKSRGWAAVPVESGAHFDERDKEMLATACLKAGIRSATVWHLEALDGLEGALDGQPFQMSKDGLLEFDRMYGHFNVALLGENDSFLVICTTDDYFLLAGPRAFVEVALGGTIAEARRAFYAWATNSEWMRRGIVTCLEVHERYLNYE